MTIPDEAVHAAHAEYHKVLGDSNRSNPMLAALTAALPFLTGVKVDEKPYVDCACTKRPHDESGTVGYPSLLCEICDGKGIVPYVKLDGPELWEIVFGIANEVAHEISDEQYTKIAEAINSVFVEPVTPVSAPSPLAHALDIDLMQRVWANLYFNEEDAGNTFQQTLNDVVDWLANRNAVPENIEKFEVDRPPPRAQALEEAFREGLEAACGVIDAHDEYDRQLCCDGRECGCYGATVHQSMQHYIRTLSSQPVADIEEEAAKTLLSGNMVKIYDACSGICKVHKFKAVLEKLASTRPTGASNHGE